MELLERLSSTTRPGRLRRALLAGGVTAVAALALAGSASANTTIKPPSGGASWITFEPHGEIFRLYDHHTNNRSVRVRYKVFEPEEVWTGYATTGWEKTLNLTIDEGTMLHIKACDYNPDNGTEVCNRNWTVVYA